MTVHINMLELIEYWVSVNYLIFFHNLLFYLALVLAVVR